MSGRGERGFTLLEMLIAMTLLGLLMLGLFGGLRLGARVWEATDARSADRARVEAVQRFIRTYLGQARPLAAADRTGGDLVAFVGRSGGLDFTATLPAHLSAGGFEHVALSLAEGDRDGRRLVLEHGKLRRHEDGRAELFELDEPETAVLLDNVAAAEFSYYGVRGRGGDAEWTDRWDDEDRLPLLVRIRIEFPESDRRTWPELTVALRIQGGREAAEARVPNR
jgi:general secretion pathway protein J